MKNVTEAFALLREIGAPPRLERHARLVGEAGELLLDALFRLDVRVDLDRVRVGIALHDVGKTVHRDELEIPGSRHEAAGEALLRAHGVDPLVARISRSHAQWDSMECSLEELLVALADKLWKGARVPTLEERVVVGIAERTGRPRWDLFVPLDDLFEKIASGGTDRLARSTTG